MGKKTNKIINLTVFCLVLCSGSNMKHNGERAKEAVETTVIPPEKVKKFPPPEFNWENTTFIDAFNAGLIKDLHDYVEKAPHITDTIIINKRNYKKRMCAGLYVAEKDKVYLKYFIPDTTDCTPQETEDILKRVRHWNNRGMVLANKAHEYHHRYITKKKVFETDLSAEDFARVCGHNEMAAYITNLLFERELVKRAILCGKSPEEWRKLVSSRFHAYWNAVERGEVNLISPFFNNDKIDNYLIIKTSSEWWLTHEYNKNVYVTEKKLKVYLKKNEWAVYYPRHEKNYQKVLDDCYTFLKDGKLINLNIFYKEGLFFSLGQGDLPRGIRYRDFDNQPEIKHMIAMTRQKSKKIQLFPPKKRTKIVRKIVRKNNSR